MTYKVNLEYHRIPPESDGWYEFRKQGIGGSEIGTVLGEDEYGNLAKLYHKKVGVLDIPRIDSEPMFHGRHLEDHVAQCWKHWWNGEYMDNYEKGIKIRKCRRVNAIVKNPKYPWLYASIDRMIPIGEKKLNGEVLEKHGILEIKTISGFEANKWKVGVPRKYILQIHQYMLIYEVDYAEICLLKDGRFIEVFAVEKDPEICEQLLNKSEQFWHMVVKPAKRWAEAYFEAVRSNDAAAVENALEYIDGYEPSPEGSKSYREFMNERYVKEHDYFVGDEYDMTNAIMQRISGEIIKEVEKIKLEAENKLRKKFVDTSAEYLRFGDEKGYVRNYYRSNSTNPTLDNRIKIELPKEDIDKLSTKIKIALHEIETQAHSRV